jgi:hypothetical protein
VVLPTPPLSAPTTITTGFAMNCPYALQIPIMEGYARDRKIPAPALGANMAETRENSIHSTARQG